LPSAFLLSPLALWRRIRRSNRELDSMRTQACPPFDALHLSSAVEAEADMSCTTDDQLLRRGSEAETERTRVLAPVVLIEENEP
jgi:predicted nucleic acid-binding protein